MPIITSQEKFGRPVPDKGMASGMAHSTQALRQATLDQLVGKFLKRVDNDPNLLYRIDDVTVFGCLLTESATMSDVELAVICVRRIDPERGQGPAKQHVGLARGLGRMFRNSYQEGASPVRENEN